MVDADNNRRRPETPYATIKVIMHDNKDNQAGNYSNKFIESSQPQFKYDIAEKLNYQPIATISISSIAGNGDDAYTQAQIIHDYFKFVGKPKFDEMNIVIIDTGEITDRSELTADTITHDYIYGFDIRIRYYKEIDRISPNIESWKMTGQLGRLNIEQKGDTNGK